MERVSSPAAPMARCGCGTFKDDRSGNPLRDMAAGVDSVAFSPDGERIVSGGADGTLRLWDLQGQQIGDPFEGHEGEEPLFKRVTSVAFSPDGERIVSGGSDGTLRLWDLQGQQIGDPFEGHEGEEPLFKRVTSVAFSPDGERIVSGGSDGTLRLWDLQGQQIGEPWEGHDRRIRSVAFSPDGQRVVSGSNDGTVRLWNLHGQQIGEAFEGHYDSRSGNQDVRSVAFTPDGTHIVSGGTDGTIRLWNLEGRSVGEPYRWHDTAAWTFAFHPDGERIFVAGPNGRMWLSNLEGRTIGTQIQAGHHYKATRVVFSPDSERIASLTGLGTSLRLWGLQGEPIEGTLVGPDENVLVVAFSPDGERIVAGDFDGMIRLWDRQGQPIGRPFTGHESGVMWVAFSQDGERIFSDASGDAVRQWDLHGQPIEDIRDEDILYLSEPYPEVGGAFEEYYRLSRRVAGGPGIATAYHPESERIVSRDFDAGLRLWNLQGEQIGEPFVGHLLRVSGVVFGSDGQHIISLGEDRTLRLWDLHGELLRTVTACSAMDLQKLGSDGPVAVLCGDRLLLFDEELNRLGQMLFVPGGGLALIEGEGVGSYPGVPTHLVETFERADDGSIRAVAEHRYRFAGACPRGASFGLIKCQAGGMAQSASARSTKKGRPGGRPSYVSDA